MEILPCHEVRFPFDPRRAVVWHTLVETYFQRFAPDGSHVLELGAGYCDFINTINAKRSTQSICGPGWLRRLDRMLWRGLDLPPT